MGNLGALQRGIAKECGKLQRFMGNMPETIDNLGELQLMWVISLSWLQRIMGNFIVTACNG